MKISFRLAIRYSQVVAAHVYALAKHIVCALLIIPIHAAAAEFFAENLSFLEVNHAIVNHKRDFVVWQNKTKYIVVERSKGSASWIPLIV